MKKLLIFLVIIVLLVPFISVIIQISNEETPFIGELILPKNEVQPGDTVTYKIPVTSSWLVDFEPEVYAKNIQLVNTKKSINSLGFNDKEVLLEVTICSLDSEDLPKSIKLNIDFSEMLLSPIMTQSIELPMFQVKKEFEIPGAMETFSTIDEKIVPEVTENSYGIIITVLILVIVILIVVISKISNRNKQEVVVKILPWDRATLALAKLQIKIEEMLGEQFFVEVSDVLRLYIEEMFALPATEQTTTEFLMEIQRSRDIEQNFKNEIRGFLNLAEMIKFAKQQATIEQKKDAIELALKFVENTAKKGESPNANI